MVETSWMKASTRKIINLHNLLRWCQSKRDWAEQLSPSVLFGKNYQLLFCKVQSKSSFCTVQVVVASQNGVAFLYLLYLDGEESFRFDGIALEGCQPLPEWTVCFGGLHAGIVTYNKAVAIPAMCPMHLDEKWHHLARLFSTWSLAVQTLTHRPVNGVLGWTPFGSGVRGAFRRMPVNRLPLNFCSFPRDFPVKLRGRI